MTTSTFITTLVFNVTGYVLLLVIITLPMNGPFNFVLVDCAPLLDLTSYIACTPVYSFQRHFIDAGPLA